MINNSLVFREKLSKKAAVGLALMIAATVGMAVVDSIL